MSVKAFIFENIMGRTILHYLQSGKRESKVCLR